MSKRKLTHPPTWRTRKRDRSNQSGLDATAGDLTYLQRSALKRMTACMKGHNRNGALHALGMARMCTRRTETPPQAVTHLPHPGLLFSDFHKGGKLV